MKVYLNLKKEQVTADTGIGQVVLAMYQHFPSQGIEIVENYRKADLVAAHVSLNESSKRIDVLHSHGLYFSDIPHITYTKWHHEVNARIIDSARRARVITVPSDWVAKPFLRDMKVHPRVIGHGINMSEWDNDSRRLGYILYNKNREGDVCTSLYAAQLAERGFGVVSTFSPKNMKIPDKLKVVGRQPFDKMKQLIKKSSIYLATTLETFGIGTLEAMAAGVPVLGFKYGGTQDIVRDRMDGYLVEPGDINGLVTGARYIYDNWADMSDACIERAKQYTWEEIIKQYCDVYNSVLAPENNDVTIIITNYNYGRWVGAAIDSCLRQTVKPKEIIVVDDGSTDDSRRVLSTYENKVKVIYQKNTGVSGARDRGISEANTSFVVCLDADDMIEKDFVKILSKELINDRGLGIAYSGLTLMDENGVIASYSHAFPPEFDWRKQATASNPPATCIPSGSMFRKDMWLRAGGYRQEYAPGEDTEFWTRGLSVGFTAKKVTDRGLFLYRNHAGGASKVKRYKPIDDRMPWMNDKLFPMGAPTKDSPTVRSYLEPTVSVIIPVGPNHFEYALDAISTVEGQTFRSWELIVIDDTGNENEFNYEYMNRVCPYVKLIRTPGGRGAGYARNKGIEMASAPLVLFLDADDFLLTNALERMVDKFLASDGRYVYSDWYSIMANGERKFYAVPEYNQSEHKLIHAVTVLMPTNYARDLMFDEEMAFYEDWDFFVRAAIKGYCGVRLAEPLIVYRLESGTRRAKAKDINGNETEQGKQILAIMKNRYESYYVGEEVMSPCCGGSSAVNSILRAKQQMGLAKNTMREVRVMEEGNTMVRMEYTGKQSGTTSMIINGRVYRGSTNVRHKFVDARPEDVHQLEISNRWKRVERVEPEVKKPEPKQEDMQKLMARRLEEAKEELARQEENDNENVATNEINTFLEEMFGIQPDPEPMPEPEVPPAVSVKPSIRRGKRGR